MGLLEVLYPHTYSINFPIAAENEIGRDNVITTVTKMLDTSDIVFVYGEDEIGKTTTLYQFTKKNAENTISCFLKSTNKFSTSLENIIYDLTRQMHFILFNDEQPTDVFLDLNVLTDYFSKLNRFSKNRKKFYIVIDGLEDFEPIDSFHIKTLLEILPLGYPCFKFIFSDFKQKTLNNFVAAYIKKGKMKVVEIPLSGFSFMECESYLKNLQLESSQIHEIQKISNQLPGRIRNIYEILNSGESYSNFLQNIDKYNDVLDFQWNLINQDDNDVMMIIAVISLEDNSYTKKQLSEFLKISENSVETCVTSFPFLETERITNCIVFKSSAIKRNFRERLKQFKNNVDEAIISFFLENKNSIEAIIELPKRLEKSKKFDDLLKLLSEENFSKILEKKESLFFLEEQTEIGIRAATELKKHVELYRLSLSKSSILEIKRPFIWEAEIEAKIELKQFENAYNLAQESILKEDKFRLLVFLCRKIKEKGLIIEQQILETIKTLYSQINPLTFTDSDEIIEIASNLLYTFPDLAIEFLDRASGGNEKFNSDLGFAKLAMLLSNMSDKNVSDSSEKIRGLNARIKNSKIKNLTTAFDFIFDDKNPEEFLKQLKKINSNSEKLQMIRIYLKENKTTSTTGLIIDYGIDTVLQESSEHPINASILSELSDPLPNITEKDMLARLINRFEPLVQTAKEKGPTINYVKLVINLGVAEFTIKGFDTELSDKFISINNIILKIQDYGIKTEAYAILYSKIKECDKTRSLERNHKLESQTLSKVGWLFDHLLIDSAEHYKITHNIVKEICKFNPQYGLQLASKLNTSLRRDQATYVGLNSYIKKIQNCKLIDFDILANFLTSIKDIEIKNSSVVVILKKFSDYDGDVATDIPKLFQYFGEVKKFYDNNDKCVSYCLILHMVEKSKFKDRFLQDLDTEIRNFIDGLNNKFERIDYCFQLSIRYVNINRQKAEEYQGRAVKEKEGLNFESPYSHALFFHSLKLSIQSFSGLFKTGVYKESDVEKIIEYIAYLPDIVGQNKLLCYFLLKVYDKNKLELFNRVFDEKIQPTISILISRTHPFSESEKMDLISDLSVVAYLYNVDFFHELIKQCETSHKNTCISTVCDYLISNRIPGDVYDFELNDYKIDGADVLSLLNLLDLLTIDVLIYDKIDELRACVKNESIPKDIIPTVTLRLKEVINTKLPDRNNIIHDGYKIISLMHVLIIEKKKNESDWQNLYESCLAVPNKSDKVYVLSILAENIPQNLKGLTKAQILTEAISTIESIRSYVARVNRYSDLKKLIKDVSLSECKTQLKKAIQDSVFENNIDLYETQKSIIDFAYEFEPSFAEDLIKIVDNDPARAPIGERLKKRFKLSQLKKDFIADRIDIESHEISQIESICHSFLGKLNAKRVASKKLERTYEWIASANKHPLSKTFSIYSAFVENANVRWTNNPNEVKSILQPLFDYTMKNVQIVKILSIRSKGKKVQFKDYIFTPLENQLIVKAGEREKALSYISKWIQDEVVDYIKICDPYFSSNDLNLLKEILMIKPDVKVYILAQKEKGEDGDLSQMYRQKWESICDQDAPITKIVIVGYKDLSGQNFISPNHDRWYTTHSSGLKVGTSYNSIGGSKNSEITIMSGVEARNIELEIINKYLDGTEDFHNGKRLSYINFTI